MRAARAQAINKQTSRKARIDEEPLSPSPARRKHPAECMNRSVARPTHPPNDVPSFALNKPRKDELPRIDHRTDEHQTINKPNPQLAQPPIPSPAPACHKSRLPPIQPARAAYVGAQVGLPGAAPPTATPLS